MPNSGESLVEEKKVWLTALACFLGGVLAVKSYEWLLSTINNKTTTKKEEDLLSNNNNNKSEVINQQLSSNKQQQDKIEEVDDEEDEDLEEEEEDWEDEEEEEEDEHKKMLLLVRTDINMQKGKMCAQCGHAALGAHRSIHYRYSKNPNEINKQHLQWLNQWHKYGAAKIAVKVNGQEMDKFQKLAKEKNLPTYRVLDAGKTQIEAGTATVLAIGPCPDSLLDFTKQLKLFFNKTTKQPKINVFKTTLIMKNSKLRIITNNKINNNSTNNNNNNQINYENDSSPVLGSDNNNCYLLNVTMKEEEKEEEPSSPVLFTNNSSSKQLNNNSNISSLCSSSSLLPTITLNNNKEEKEEKEKEILEEQEQPSSPILFLTPIKPTTTTTRTTTTLLSSSPFFSPLSSSSSFSIDINNNNNNSGSTTINGSSNNYNNNNLSPTSPLVKRTFSCYSPTINEEELLSTARLQQKDLSFVTTNLTQEFINFDLTNGDNSNCFKNATEFGSFMTILCENKTLQNLHISTYYSSPNAFEIFLQKNKNCKQFIAEFNDKSKLLILNVNCFLFLENNLNLKILKLINFDLNDENLFFNEILWKLNHIDIELKRDSFESSFSQ
ncbi:hypothetical protein ABK040_008660 [Willaertia magna]